MWLTLHCIVQETFGELYSTYGVSTAAANETSYNLTTAYNYANTSDDSAMQTLFQPFLNGARFYPQAMGECSTFALPAWSVQGAFCPKLGHEMC